MTDERPLSEAELVAWRHGAMSACTRAGVAARLGKDAAASATLAE